jgi:hypothetical protein
VIKCGKSCLRFIFGCGIMCAIAFGISEVVKLYLKVDVYEDFIQDYFELTDGNTTELTGVLLKYRDESKTIRKLKIPLYPSTNNYMDVVNGLYKKAIKDLEEFKDGLKEQEEKVDNLIDILEENHKKVNKKPNKIKEKD